MQLATVFSCVRVRGETFAQLSPKVFERMPDGSREDRPDHWLSKRLKTSPGFGYSPFDFGERMSNDLDLWGNFYAYRVWSGDEVVDYIPLEPADVQVKRNLTTLKLEYTVPSMTFKHLGTLTQREILHVKRMSRDGIKGITPIEQCRSTMNLSLDIDQHGSTVFRNGARPSAVMEFPEALDDEQHERLQRDLDTNWNGAKANRTLILESGGKMSPLAMGNRDAQFLESRKFQRTEICGMYRVPPHLIADLERSTNNNIEQQSLEFVMYGVLPDARRVESIFNSIELAGSNFFMEYQIESLIRGDFEGRMKGYQLAIQSGLMTPNFVCQKENWPTDPENGDKRLMMVNVASLEKAVTMPAEGATN